jgi:succinate dehydrogenase/fumarate reductase flavoprotein subunit
MEPAVFESRAQLGDWDDRVRTSPHLPALTLDELSDADDVAGGATGTVGLSAELKALAERRRRDGVRTTGEALAATLLRGALDLGVEIRTGVRVRRLVQDDDGRVTGVRADGPDGPIAVAARRGVVVATGGFEWNADMVRTFLGVQRLWPQSPPTNVGDGLTMGLAAGAGLANMTATFGYPACWDGRAELEGHPLHTATTPRQEAGCIAVNREGRRFMNEGVCSTDAVRAHRTFDPVSRTRPNAAPVWLVFDRRVRERIELGDLTPGAPTPDWVLEAPTLAALAAAMGVDATVLEEEVARFSANARKGADPDFHRGTVWFEGFTAGGPTPERSLAPIDEPPFFALRMYEGALSTAGGLRTDRDARVLSMDGEPIDGLYAAGTAAASIFGATYPSGGATLGPALTFGYLAGRHLAGLPSDPHDREEVAA